ncbi:LysR family transcriptional regulator [uncultured Tateyamaria sp.]|uniref:LysR family transcriptional regulator n=1 Tax=uncultured Tateyamaria sp. TaxID=455651 RepID=UPI0026283D7C|nr:LysR family transcriptional regulator [uncultured Tateyamaria sp.]
MNELIDASLSDLALLVRVKDNGGFSAAARITKIPQPTVSRRIATLEERVGVRLFNRTTRSVVLTEAGERVYLHAKQMLEQAEAVATALEEMNARPSGTLRLTCPVIIGQCLINEVLAQYIATYPEVRIKLEATARRVDLIEEGYDIAIRVGELPDSGLAMTPLGAAETAFFATPDYLAKATPIKGPNDLPAHPLFLFSGTLEPSVLQFSRADKKMTAELTPRFACNDVTPILNTTLRNSGLAQLPRFAVQRELSTGALVDVLPHWRLPPADINALTPSFRGSSPAVKAFLAMAKEGVRDLLQ